MPPLIITFTSQTSVGAFWWVNPPKLMPVIYTPARLSQGPRERTQCVCMLSWFRALYSQEKVRSQNLNVARQVDRRSSKTGCKFEGEWCRGTVLQPRRQCRCEKTYKCQQV